MRHAAKARAIKPITKPVSSQVGSLESRLMKKGPRQIDLGSSSRRQGRGGGDGLRLAQGAWSSRSARSCWRACHRNRPRDRRPHHSRHHDARLATWDGRYGWENAGIEPPRDQTFDLWLEMNAENSHRDHSDDPQTAVAIGRFNRVERQPPYSVIVAIFLPSPFPVYSLFCLDSHYSFRPLFGESGFVGAVPIIRVSFHKASVGNSLQKPMS